MVDGLRPYSEYRDSGVSWLGDIPAHWDIEPGFAEYAPKQVKNIGMVEKTVLSLSYGRIIVKPPERLHGLVPASFETYQIIDPGDIIIRATDLQNDKTSLRVGIARDRGIITSAYLCLQVRGDLTPDYGYLLLHTYDLTKALYSFGSGLRQNLDYSDFKRMPMLVPPLSEQAAIIRFLDHADRRIRRHIRAKRKLIALLNEQKQIIIQNAVTRGLDPDVPMRDSGVEWLGEIPAHWEITRLKRISPRLAGRLIVQPHRFFADEGIPIVFAYNVKPGRIVQEDMKRISFEADRQYAHCRVRAGDLLTIRVGYPGTTAVVPPELDGCHFASTMLIRQSPLFFSPWLSLVMNSQVIQDQVNIVNYGAAQKQFNIGDAAEFILPFPSIEEQQEIAESLDDNLAPIDSAIDGIQTLIDLGREYRTRLIADVVTGKLDVRAAALSLPDEEDGTDELDETGLLDEENSFDEVEEEETDED